MFCLRGLPCWVHMTRTTSMAASRAARLPSSGRWVSSGSTAFSPAAPTSVTPSVSEERAMAASSRSAESLPSCLPAPAAVTSQMWLWQWLLLWQCACMSMSTGMRVRACLCMHAACGRTGLRANPLQRTGCCASPRCHQQN